MTDWGRYAIRVDQAHAALGHRTFKAAGGEELTLVPSLNAHPAWVDAVAELARAISFR